MLGWLCIAMGLFPVAIAVGVINPDPASVHAPLWVIGVCGLVFVAAGAAILVGPGNKLVHLFAALILLSFALISGWVAFFGPANGFSGGIPFLPHATNVKIARWVFGGGSALCLLLFFYAISQMFNPKLQSEQASK